MRQLSLHAVRKIAQSHDSLRSAFPSDQLVTLQIVTLDIMEGEKALKVKARVVVSDGVSKIHVMFPEKVWAQHVSHLHLSILVYFVIMGWRFRAFF